MAWQLRSTPRARARRLLVTSSILALIGLFLTPGTAQAASTCASAVLPTVTVDMPSGGDFGTLDVGGGGAIRLAPNGAAAAQCGTATTSNTTTITLTGGAGDQTLTIDISTAFINGGTDIIFNGTMGAGSDTLIIEGSSGADNVGLGTSGINLNAGGVSVDVVSALTGTIEAFTVNGNAGGDTISASGAGGTDRSRSGLRHTLIRPLRGSLHRR